MDIKNSNSGAPGVADAVYTAEVKAYFEELVNYYGGDVQAAYDEAVKDYQAVHPESIPIVHRIARQMLVDRGEVEAQPTAPSLAPGIGGVPKDILDRAKEVQEAEEARAAAEEAARVAFLNEPKVLWDGEPIRNVAPKSRDFASPIIGVGKVESRPPMPTRQRPGTLMPKPISQVPAAVKDDAKKVQAERAEAEEARKLAAGNEETVKAPEGEQVAPEASWVNKTQKTAVPPPLPVQPRGLQPPPLPKLANGKAANAEDDLATQFGVTPSKHGKPKSFLEAQQKRREQQNNGEIGSSGP